ncbi:MAG: hypothetical protein U0P81_05525 [Holophagaceae bacterium]
MLVLLPPVLVSQAHTSADIEALVEAARRLLMPAPGGFDPTPVDRMPAEAKRRGEALALLQRVDTSLRARRESGPPLHAQVIALRVLAEQQALAPVPEAQIAAAFVAIVKGDRRILARHGRDDPRRLPFLLARLDLQQALGRDAQASEFEAARVIEAQVQDRERLRVELLIRQLKPDRQMSVEQSIQCVDALDACKRDPRLLDLTRLVMGSLQFRPVQGHMPHFGRMSQEASAAQNRFLSLVGDLESSLPDGHEVRQEFARVRTQLAHVESFGTHVVRVVDPPEEAKPGPPVWDEVTRLEIQGHPAEAADLLSDAVAALRAHQRNDYGRVQPDRALREELVLRIKAGQWDRVENLYSHLVDSLTFLERNPQEWHWLAEVPAWVEGPGAVDRADNMQREFTRKAYDLQSEDVRQDRAILDALEPFGKALLQALWHRALDGRCPVPQRILEAMDEASVQRMDLRIQLLTRLGHFLEAFLLQSPQGTLKSPALAKLAEDYARRSTSRSQAPQVAFLLSYALDQASEEQPRSLARMWELKAAMGRNWSYAGIHDLALRCFLEADALQQRAARGERAWRPKPLTAFSSPLAVSWAAPEYQAWACRELEALGRFDECLRLAARIPIPKKAMNRPPFTILDEWAPAGAGRLRARRTLAIRRALLAAGIDRRDVQSFLAK